MNLDTYFTRFMKKCGSPYPHKAQVPLIIGSELVNMGITSDLPAVLGAMIRKNPVDYYEILPEKILPYLEYQCVDEGRNVICSWSTSLLTTTFSVLDSKPYSRIKVYHSTECMPIFATRDEIAVFCAPEVWTIQQNGYTELRSYNRNIPKVEYPIVIKWLAQMEHTTWWSVLYTDNHNYTEYILKCSNCGAEIGIGDHDPNHPQCFCWCGCDICEKRRWAKDYMDRMEWYSRRTWD